MSYLNEAHSTWQRRQRRRQRITLLVAVLLVLALGVGSYGYVQGWFGQDDEAISQTGPPCPVPSDAPLTAGQVSVNVYNTTSRNGLAARVAKSLTGRAFVIDHVANDPLHATVPGTALVRHGTAGARAAALVAAQVPGAKVVKDNRTGTDVDLVLGAKFVALGPSPSHPASTTSMPTTTPSTPCIPLTSPTAPPTTTGSTGGRSGQASSTTSSGG